MSLPSLRPVHLIRLVQLLLCSFFLLPVAFSAKALAASDPITVTSQRDVVHFPGSIDFSMAAKDIARPIVQVTLYITYKEPPYTFQKEHAVNIGRPAQVIAAHWHEDTSGDNFHTAGTLVEYDWVLQDSANNYHTTPSIDFKTSDTRFSWQHLTQGMLQVNWYDRPGDFGQLLLDRATNSLNHISQVLGGGLLRPINLWVYASNQDFHGALAPGSYEWVGGEAHPALNEAFISVVDANDDTLVRDMPHELTHLVFHQLTAQGPLAPTWFDEGLAVYNQFFHEPEMRARFQQGLRSKSLLRLYRISDNFPADGDLAYLAYAQSWNLIDYMYTTFGHAKMAQLIKKMNDSQADFNEDLTQALGMDQDHLENQWLLHLGQPGILRPDQVTPTPQAPLQTSQSQTVTLDSTALVFITAGSLLIFLPIIGIVAILLYQRRKRQQLLAMETPKHFLTTPQAPRQVDSSARNAGSLHFRPSNPVYAPPEFLYYPASQPQAQQTHQPAQNQAFFTQEQQGRQTYIPFPSFAPQQTSGEQGESEESEDAGSAPAPYGPFQENLNQQPLKKAPQE
ncbi:MAG TPA: peptidase MA family metallohydrolase [Ktedonobacteraceae bacterium]|nr:peptidase MA family metallohydrolase [Ktedonobacteraceae bacterium]